MVCKSRGECEMVWDRLLVYQSPTQWAPMASWIDCCFGMFWVSNKQQVKRIKKNTDNCWFYLKQCLQQQKKQQQKQLVLHRNPTLLCWANSYHTYKGFSLKNNMRQELAYIQHNSKLNAFTLSIKHICYQTVISFNISKQAAAATSIIINNNMR